jgi:TonB-dependent receptor
VLDIQGGKGAYREYTDGIDNNNSFDFNYKLELPRRNGMNMKLKTGFRLQSKDRKFEKRSLAIINSSSSDWSSDVLDTYENEEFGSAFEADNAFYIDESGQFHHGLILVDETSKNAFNGYEATEDVNAGYFLVDYPISIGGRNFLNSIRILGGLRYEDYLMNLETYNPITGAPATTVFGDTANAELDQTDVLPSLNLILDTTNDIKLRMAFSKTLGRPQFRELAPLAYQEFYNGEVAIGYPYLSTSSINNYDLRLEWYPSAAELLSIGVFAKDFTNPIETALITTPDLTYKTFQNALSAETYGIELEARKRIPFIPINVGNGFISANATFANSEVVSNPVVTLYNGTEYGNAASNTKRPLQGQSNFMLNAAIDMNFAHDYSFALSYNTFSKKISAIGTGVLGDEYEFPFHSLNFTASKKFGPIKISLKAKNLLDSQITFGIIDQGTDEIKVKNSYKPGRSISIGISYNNL